MADGGSVDEIASLLDQCSPDELASILQAIEGGEDLDFANPIPTAATGVTGPGQAQPPQQQALQQGVVPAPPSGPPPSNAQRRPPPAEAVVTVGEMKKLLEEHSAGVLSEVRKLVPHTGVAAAPTSGVDAAALQAVPSESLSLEVLSAILGQRDQEVGALEARLAGLQEQLAAKDQRVMDLSGELDGLNREVRHRQLDLEFQQLKLEERVRSNKELENAQRSLTSMIDETGRDARHAALDADLSRSMPRTPRVQGSLPWMLRKNRPLGADAYTTSAALGP